MNNRVTICHSTTYEKPQKMRYFRPENFSFVLMALIWGQSGSFTSDYRIQCQTDTNNYK